MGAEEKLLVAFNRGIVSPIGLSRIDIQRLAMSAEIQTNFMPRVLGSMMLRPGLEFLGSTLSDSAARFFPFVFSTDVVAILEFTPAKMRVWIGDALVTHNTVATAIVNDGFGAAGSWVDNDEAGATSTISGGLCRLNGDGNNFARRTQSVAVAGPDQAIEHTIHINVDRGSVRFRIGTTSGADDVTEEVYLSTGFHYLRFTPNAATVFVDVAASTKYISHVDFCGIKSSGNLEIETIWGAADLDQIRVTQSGDVIFVAADGERQYRIERRSVRGWGVVEYLTEDGPFRIQNTSPTTLAASATFGDITLTASKAAFKSTNVGSLIRISSVGQFVTASVTAISQFTDPIRVVASGNPQRAFDYEITGTSWVGTITLQFSVGAPGSWIDVPGFSFTINTGPASYYDALDGQEIYYRFGSTAWTSGAATVSLTYAAGSIDGVARVTSFSSETSVGAIVLKDLGGTIASSAWWEGAWSDRRGWPTAVALYESRLWWVGADNIWGSVTDEYETFDDSVEGDSGPISRRIGEGPIESIHWLLAAGRLLMGTAQNSTNIPPALISLNNPMAVRSSSFGEPLTPNNFNIKDDAGRGVFVDRTKQRLYELTATAKQYSSGLNDYTAEDLSIFAPELNSIGITRIAAQIKPDVRVHCVRADGTVAVLIFDRAENVVCWIEVETDGDVEDVVVLPGIVEDQVYYVVERVINSVTKRYFEKWALESEAHGDAVNKMADSFIQYTGVATTTITGLTHLEGETVLVWGNSKDLGTYVVSGGQITGITESVTSAVVGLVYTGQFKSAKLASLEATGLNERRIIRSLGLNLYKTHCKGIKYGPSFSKLYDLPEVEQGAVIVADTIHDTYDEDVFPYGGNWSTDSRLHLEATAPKPCTVTAAKMIVET